MTRDPSGERLAAFLSGLACGLLLGWAGGPLGRRLAAMPSRPAAVAAAAGHAAESALGRIQGLLGEIRALMAARTGRMGGGPG